MSNDPLAVSEAWPGPPDEADYEAFCAALLATERGRRFLTEYASRNCAPTTRTLGDPPLQSPSRSRDLAELAAAINRIKAEIATSDAPESNGLAAAERIQDIAFALRERDVDAALCDALEAALREIGVAFALNEAATERARKSADLLREHAGRISDLIALWVAGDRTGPPAAEAVTVPPVPETAISQVAEALADRAAPPPVALFETKVAEGENFAPAVAALATALPTLADPSALESGPQSEAADAVLPPADREAAPEPAAVEPGSDLIGDDLPNVAVMVEPQRSETAIVSIETMKVEPSPIAPPPLDAPISVDGDSESDLPSKIEREHVAPQMPDASAMCDLENAADATARDESPAAITGVAVPSTNEGDVAYEQTATAEDAQPNIEVLADAGSGAALSSETSPREQLWSEDPPIPEMPSEPAPSDPPLPEQRSSGTAASSQVPELVMPTAPVEDLPHLEPDGYVQGDAVPAISHVSSAGDVRSETEEAAMTGPLDPAPQVETGPAAMIDLGDASPAAPDEMPAASGSPHSVLPDVELADPQDDPGDLFDPLPLPSPIAAPPVEDAAVETVLEAAAVEEGPLQEAPVRRQLSRHRQSRKYRCSRRRSSRCLSRRRRLPRVKRQVKRQVASRRTPSAGWIRRQRTQRPSLSHSNSRILLIFGPARRLTRSLTKNLKKKSRQQSWVLRNAKQQTTTFSRPNPQRLRFHRLPRRRLRR